MATRGTPRPPAAAKSTKTSPKPSSSSRVSETPVWDACYAEHRDRLAKAGIRFDTSTKAAS